jgi:hypothetical protein
VYFDETARLRDVRVEYFRRHGLGPDGGYTARWARYRMGPMTLLVPNTAARRRALPLHDLHHIATGYDTSLVGESQIAAWELGSGCGGYGAAWVLNLSAFVMGIVIAPRRVWRAFRRGRASSSLYAEEWDERWLDGTVNNLRQQLGIDAAPMTNVLVDALLFAACAVPGVAVVAAFAAMANALLR